MHADSACLPKAWPSHAKSAILHVISLAQFALTYTNLRPSRSCQILNHSTHNPLGHHNTAGAFPYPLAGGPTFDILTYGGTRSGTLAGVVVASGTGWGVAGLPLVYDDVAGKVTASGAAMLWNVHVGDTDANGIVNLADLTALATNYGNSGPAMNWSTGDFDCNGLVNLADLTALATVYGATYGGTSEVPEPCTLGLLLLGGLALIRRKR